MIRSLLDADDFRPFNKEEREIFSALSTTENSLSFSGVNLKDVGVPATNLEKIIREVYGDEVATSFHVAVMTKRLALMSPTVSYSVFTLLFLSMSSDRVGVAVMWSYTMMDYYRRHNELMSLEKFESCFPKGMPTEDAMGRIWDEQKQVSEGFGSDNQIDDRKAWAI